MIGNFDKDDLSYFAACILLVLVSFGLTLYGASSSSSHFIKCVKISDDIRYCEKEVGKKNLCFFKIEDDELSGFGTLKVGCDEYSSEVVGIVKKANFDDDTMIQ